MINSEKIEQIKSFYAEAFQKLNADGKIPEIEIQFYPYVGINHTIRLRRGVIFVRIAEMFADAPPLIQQALAWILVPKLLRKKVPAQASKIYRDFVRTESVTERATQNKIARGRKVITSARGEIYDLAEIFARLNQIYFQNALPETVLTWSAQKTFRILGHHDAAHRTIVISKSLDDRKVPQFVTEHVVYHEMLHVKHPTVHHNGRRYNHTPAFRRDEEKFAHYAAAEKWIAENSLRLKRKVRREKRKK